MADDYETLSQALAKLEAEDPNVRAAAESFERMKKQIIEGRVHALPCTIPNCYWHNEETQDG